MLVRKKAKLGDTNIPSASKTAPTASSLKPLLSVQAPFQKAKG